MFERIIFAVICIGSLAGLYACTYLRAHANRTAYCLASLNGIKAARHRPMHAWGIAFFSGLLVLNLNYAMGDRCPVPLWAQGFDPRVLLAQLVSCWLVVCAAGMAVHFAVVVRRQEVASRQSHSRLNPWAVGMVAVLALGFLPGCAGSTDPFVIAEEATYQALAPDYLQLVGESQRLTPSQKTRRQTTVATWRASLDEKEGHGPTTQPATTQP